LESGAKDRIDIDDSLRKKYQEITNLEVNDESFLNSNSLTSFVDFQLITSEDYSQFSCKKCVDNIENCVSTKRYLIQNQEWLTSQKIKIEEMDENLEALLFPEIQVERYDIPEFIQKNESDLECEPVVKKIRRGRKGYAKPGRPPKIDKPVKPKPTEPKEPIYQRCHVCMELTPNLGSHTMRFHRGLKFICDVCGQEFKWIGKLTGHLKVFFLTKVGTKFYINTSCYFSATLD
jgi:hypothetical protein